MCVFKQNYATGVQAVCFLRGVFLPRGEQQGPSGSVAGMRVEGSARSALNPYWRTIRCQTRVAGRAR
jgi:hypothetical protein